jgi:hypothetical protein
MLAETLAGIRSFEDLPRLATSLGYSADWSELAPGTFGASAVRVVGRQGEFEWYGLDTAGEPEARKAARALAARGIPAAVLALDEAARQLVVATSDTAPLHLALDHPEPLALGRLARCTARNGELALATGLRIAEALAGTGVDQRFFAAFRRMLSRVMECFPARMAPADRHALGLLQLTRILFLYFVEARGWLGPRRVLREEVDRCLSGGRSLHRDFLDPLFFGTLNRPYQQRSRLARRFGPVPFLNGGLFEPHPLERRWRVTLPTPLLRDAFDQLFERFHFTLTMPSGEAIAPDMLGRVFEGVMEPGERHLTGSYYTPGALVEAVVGDALAGWLQYRLGSSEDEAFRRLAEPDRLTRNILSRIRILDPAVGSGAFLLGALRFLAGPGQSGDRAVRLRNILGRCLYGVDRNAAAVRLAELRLWLEVIAAEPADQPDQVAPLPNLDALIRQGDSLVDPVRGHRLHPPVGGASLESLRAAVVTAAGPAKRPAVRALRRAEQEVARSMLEGTVRDAEQSITELLELGRTPTLFGEKKGLTREEQALVAALRQRRAATRRQLRELNRAGAVPWFHYPVQFADVIQRGGFDLVIGNPPWVRAEALERDDRRYLIERFRWFRAGKVASGYGHLPDLSVAFLERALELTAPAGVVAFLLPAKLATSGYGTAVREGISRSYTVVVAADLRDDARSSFDATVYPMALIVRKEEPRASHGIRLQLGPSVRSSGIAQCDLGAAPWALVSDPIRQTQSRLRAEFPNLGERHLPQLGVKTGCNQVFLDPPDTVEPTLLRPAIRGRDVLPFRVRSTRRLLWPCDENGNPLDALPPGAADYIERFAGKLRRRSDHRAASDPLWTLFRTRPASARYRVIWPDLGRQLAAAPLVGEQRSRMIPLNTCYVLPVRDGATAVRLAAWLNSTWCRALATIVADPASGGFRRFNAGVVASLPAPPALFGDGALLELGRAGMAGTLSQKALDERTAALLGLSDLERHALGSAAAGSAQPGRRDARAG